MMFFVVLSACLFSLSLSATTHRPHQHNTHPSHGPHPPHGTHPHGTGPTHEPHVNENFLFHYDGIAHVMAVKTAKHCYIYAMTDQQRMDVHMPSGLHSIEKSIIDLIDTNPTGTMMSHDDLNMMSKSLGHFCHQQMLPITKLN